MVGVSDILLIYGIFQGGPGSLQLRFGHFRSCLDRAGEGTTEVGTARKRHVRTKSGSQPPILQNLAKSVRIWQKSVKIRPNPAKSGCPQIRLSPSLSGKIPAKSVEIRLRTNPAKSIKIRLNPVKIQQIRLCPLRLYPPKEPLVVLGFQRASGLKKINLERQYSI